MLKLMRLLTIVCLFFGFGTMTYAASPNPVSSAYMQSYLQQSRQHPVLGFIHRILPRSLIICAVMAGRLKASREMMARWS